MGVFNLYLLDHIPQVLQFVAFDFQLRFCPGLGFPKIFKGGKYALKITQGVDQQ